MNDINQYFADKCGVNTCVGDPSYAIPLPYWYHLVSGIKYLYKWDISDPRCREIIREKYGLATDRFREGNWSSFPRNIVTDAIKYMGNGETIPEAELACLQAIYEARDE